MPQDFTAEERERMKEICPECLQLYDRISCELEEYTPSCFDLLKGYVYDHRREITFGLGIAGLTGLGSLISYFANK